MSDQAPIDPNTDKPYFNLDPEGGLGQDGKPAMGITIVDMGRPFAFAVDSFRAGAIGLALRPAP